MVAVRKSKLDITEVMMKHATMGRAAEMPAGWEPPGMVSRKIAEVLTQPSARPGAKSSAALGGGTEIPEYLLAREEMRIGHGQPFVVYNPPQPQPPPHAASQVRGSPSAPCLRQVKAKPCQWTSMMTPKRGALSAAAALAVATASPKAKVLGPDPVLGLGGQGEGRKQTSETWHAMNDPGLACHMASRVPGIP
jgi:hypothetical protein